MSKTAEDYFSDWESSTFGFGYGSGEPHTLAALRGFLLACPAGDAYDYQKLEAVLTPAVAWLLINILAGVDVIEYGTSPRYGWLTDCGKALRAFVETRTVDDLVTIVCEKDENYFNCYPDVCNCGPRGHDGKRYCDNPFWRRGPHP